MSEKIIVLDGIHLHIPDIKSFIVTFRHNDFEYVIDWQDESEIADESERFHCLNRIQKRKCASEAYTHWMLQANNSVDDFGQYTEHGFYFYEFAMAWANWGGLI